MRIRIDKGSNVTICRQLSEQIVFLIATGRLKAGDALPSVRQMALRHKIHANTVSEAYKDLVERQWVERRRGKKMVVRELDEVPASRKEDLDDLIDAAIRSARERGYTLRQLRKRVRERLLMDPPDHVLIVEDEPGLRRLLQQELSKMLPLTVEITSPDTLAGNQGPIIGALVVSLPGRAKRVVSILPRGHPFLVLEPSGVDAHVKLIQQLRDASVIGVASISQEFLHFARDLLAPVIGGLHSMEEHLIDEHATRDLSGMDLVFCDTVARRSIKARRIAHYRLISGATAQDIVNRIASSVD
ncbi:MAG: hypothetical protein DMG13_04350 [Acidobacteria bacterium]|nr:MAG: hypothetical protein DMG13_04350 [Acidobacteriota bacterium]